MSAWPLSNKLSHWSGLACLLVILGLFTGCKTSGEKMVRSAKEKVHEGMSREEVIALLGKPKESLRGFDEIAIDLFYSPENNPSHRPADAGYSGTTSLDSVSVRYSADRKVEKVLHSKGNVIWNNKAFGSVPGGSVVHVLDTRLIKKGKTTLKQLTEWYGDPTSTTLSFNGQAGYCWIFINAGPLTGLKMEMLMIEVDAAEKVDSLVVTENWNWDY